MGWEVIGMCSSWLVARPARWEPSEATMSVRPRALSRYEVTAAKMR